MREELPVWIVAALAAVATIGSSVLNILLASKVVKEAQLETLKALLFAAFSLQIIALGCLSYYCLMFTRISLTKHVAWTDATAGAGFNTVALVITGIALIWLTSRPDGLQQQDSGLRDAGLILWAMTLALHGMFFATLAKRTQQVISKHVPRVQVTTLESATPQNKNQDIVNRHSFCSRDTTLASSRPCTPATSRTYSLRSSSTRVASSLRSKFTRTSARSSLELPPFPAGEATALGNAFDRYDTSSINPDVRNTILSSSPHPIRPDLEPIPGSRPSSPDGAAAALPQAATLQQPPHSPTKAQMSNPFDSVPSSPPNFSRPTSKAYHQHSASLTIRQPRVSASMTDLIHPLFRPDSPALPQILTSNTMVTASPLANQPITPKTLSRLRSGSDLRAKNDKTSASIGADRPPLPIADQWHIMPPINDTPRPRSKSHSSVVGQQRPGTAGSESSDIMKSTKTSNLNGSPGPSIIEEDELPPILPGFVLSAGSRSSLVGYGKRKSTKRNSTRLE